MADPMTRERQHRRTGRPKGTTKSLDVKQSEAVTLRFTLAETALLDERRGAVARATFLHSIVIADLRRDRVGKTVDLTLGVGDDVAAAGDLLDDRATD